MLDLIELLFGILDVLSGTGDLLHHWRFFTTFGLATAAAVLLYLHLPWDTANTVISGLLFLGGIIGGVVWESSHRRH